MSPESKTAFITGAGSGLGRSMALAFGQNKHKVAVADINLPAAEKTVDEIRSAKGEATAIQLDVANESQVECAITETIRSLGGIDVLISNAGIQIINPIVDFTFSDWRKMQSVHVDGAFLLTRAAMRQMIAQKRGGSIIYTGSIHSHIASPNKSAYIAAKHALLGLAKAVAVEGAKYGIRSNTICPGFVRTPLVEKQIPEQAIQLGITEEEVIKNVMLRATVDGEFTSLEDVANTALFLATFPTNALTGQSVVVAHGHFMQ
jgi:3-hydroxybutyrate dehydrogenase